MPVIFDFKVIVSWLKTHLNNPIKGFAILDGENAIMNKSKKVSYMTNFMTDCKTYNLKPIIVGKVSDIKRLRKRIPEVEIPDDVIYFFLHGNNKKCPDDAFIIELYNVLKSESIESKIFTTDKFSNRKNWGDKVYSTMISYNLYPTRPRTHTDDKTIIYKPNLKMIVDSEIKDKVELR